MMPCSDVVGYQCFRGPYSLHFTLKMEAAWCFKTLVSHHITTVCYTPEYQNLNLYRCF